MKRFCLWMMALLSALTLCGCQGKESSSTYDVTHNGKTYTVDQEQGTIACGGVIYQFTISSRGRGSADVEILYPDGSEYHWTEEPHGGYGGWSEDYDPKAQGYVSGEVLWDVLQMGPSGRRKSDSNPMSGLLLLAVGAFPALAPRAAWTLSHGWRFKNAEPSDLALAVNRVSGAVLMFIGAFLLLGAVF